MEEFVVIGKQIISYVSKANKNVEGIKLFVTYDFPEKANADGTACDSFFCKTEVAECVSVGDIIEPIYNKYGSIVGINKI